MRKEKIRVFLSGVVNATNAQNLNCRALLRHHDREKFEVRTLTVYSGDLPLPQPFPANTFYPIRYPAKIWHWVQLIRGILWADVAYLCKPEYWKLQRFLVRFFRKKSFITIEGVIAGAALDRSMKFFGNVENIRAFYAMATKSFAITKAMIVKNNQSVGLPDPDGVLYLGTDYDVFACEKQVDKLTDVILIGADLKRKGIDDYLVVARRFPQLTFHVAGGGVGGTDYAAQCRDSGLTNVVFHGSVNHQQLKKLLKEVQLHVFPSRAEGFPKVTLETAAAGVPSLVYDDYGASEWIEQGGSGFVVKTLDEMVGVVQRLIDHPELLQKVSEGAREMARRFDWKVLVKDWEREIEAMCEA